MDYSGLVSELLARYWWVIPLIVAFKILEALAPIIKGRIGEGQVNLAAKFWLNPKIYHLIKDVTIPSGNGTTQVDHVIASIYGLFVIETKNYKGWIFGDAKSREWTQVNFRKKNRFQNPLHQNNAHVRAMASLLGIPKGKIRGVVCFMGDAKFKTDIPAGVFIQSRYVSYIKSFRTPVFTEKEVEQLMEQIESGRLKRGFKTNRAHVRQLKARHAASPATDRKAPAAPDNTAGKTCPKCGAEMVLRTARRGANAGNQFWGCTNYPKCRATLPAAV